MISGIDKLSSDQRELLGGWLPGTTVVLDHSWGLVGTVVLELSHEGSRYIVKAGDAHDHHVARELRAHRSWLRPWTAHQRAPELVFGDAQAKLIVTRYLPGRLVQDSPDEWRPETYQQAGLLLAQLHGQLAVEDERFEAEQKQKALHWLDSPHRIEPAIARRLRVEVESWDTPSVTTVPTHGDWQPRNWLVSDGVVSVIDFGRADLRPDFTDLARLDAQQFREDPILEAAFLEGYGRDPREPQACRRHRVREAIGTAVWAYQVGDGRFERQGHQMIADVLAAG